MRAPLRRRQSDDCTSDTPPEKRLAFAVLAQAADDAVLGDQGAVAWLAQENPGIAYWCGLVDYEPGYIWRRVKQAMARPVEEGRRRVFTDSELNLAIGLHDATGTWDAAAAALSTNRNTITNAIQGAGYFYSHRGYRVVNGVYQEVPADLA